MTCSCLLLVVFHVSVVFAPASQQPGLPCSGLWGAGGSEHPAHTCWTGPCKEAIAKVTCLGFCPQGRFGVRLSFLQCQRLALPAVRAALTYNHFSHTWHTKNCCVCPVAQLRWLNPAFKAHSLSPRPQRAPPPHACLKPASSQAQPPESNPNNPESIPALDGEHLEDTGTLITAPALHTTSRIFKHLWESGKLLETVKALDVGKGKIFSFPNERELN